MSLLIYFWFQTTSCPKGQIQCTGINGAVSIALTMWVLRVCVHTINAFVITLNVKAVDLKELVMV